MTGRWYVKAFLLFIGYVIIYEDLSRKWCFTLYIMYSSVHIKAHEVLHVTFCVFFVSKIQLVIYT